jgi:hypothetical protein
MPPANTAMIGLIDMENFDFRRLKARA